MNKANLKLALKALESGDPADFIEGYEYSFSMLGNQEIRDWGIKSTSRHEVTRIHMLHGDLPLGTKGDACSYIHFEYATTPSEIKMDVDDFVADFIDDVDIASSLYECTTLEVAIKLLKSHLS